MQKQFHAITPQFAIHTDLVSITLQEADTTRFQLRGQGGQLVIYCPRTTQWHNAEFQLWFRSVLRQALRMVAHNILPGRLQMWAQRTGLRYNRLAIKATKSKWGSFSSLGNVNLSIYLMLMDSVYVDYTICHELCHSAELNHSSRFWQLLATHLDADPKRISRDMNAQVRAWYEAADPRYLIVTNA